VRLLTIRTVLAATDLVPSSDVALESANRLARAAGASLHVAHVMAPWGSETVTAARLEAADASVRAALRRAGVAEGASNVHVVPGSPAEGSVRSLTGWRPTLSSWSTL
jgi:nucleotide-binding universal stress UspA family protein